MSKQHTHDQVNILGVGVDVMYLAEAINYICNYAADPARPAAYVIKPYVEFLDRAAGHPELTELLNGAELSIADGVAVLWAAHYLYAGPRTARRFVKTLTQIVLAPNELAWPVPERAAGTNFTWPLLRSAADRKLRVYLIGKETAADIEQVAGVIHRTVPNLQIVGTLNGRDPASRRGQVSEDWLGRTATRISDARPDLVLVGLGFPLQEQVCAQLCQAVGHGVFIGEGGTFDYDSFGGARRKAPAAVQRAGLEWLWRLILEPSRFRRQLAIPRFIGKVWKSRS